MSKYELFRKMNAAEGAAETAKIANFIENSLSSTTIYHSRLNETKKVVLTRDHREGNIEIILFTHALNKHKKVKMGDYIKHNHKNFLVFMEYDHPLKKEYHKFKILECNITIKVDDLSLPAAYFSAMRSFVGNISTKLAGSANIFENMRPVVVVKDDSALTVNFRFLAAGEAYKVINIDRISNPGIAYLSVEQVPLNVITDDLSTDTVTTYKEPEPVDPGIPNPEPETPTYKKGEIVTFEIIDGYVVFKPKVEVISRSSTEITFRVPYDISLLTIKTKNLQGTEVITEREVI